MKSHATGDFWRSYNSLPAEIRVAAEKQFRLWQRNPRHGSLRFKEIKDDLWSARVTRGYRALATKVQDTWVWFWIGTHDDYEKLIK